MRRSRFLKVTSILSMLCSLVRLTFGIMMTNLYSTALSFGTIDRTDMRLVNVTMALLALSAAAELVCGFKGALNWEEPLRARNTAAWGAVSLLLGLAGNLMQARIGYGVSYVAWITGLGIPALFFAAALRFALRAVKE